ncbi:maleylpyruvate isomerase family mycothiol-dependent enzyme [Streptomyces sp. W16]|uniref:maleylpyruvate isomerase family mycothiol-dependent enzyme n=1 Tax=Streptomyces sp. W16 TaxID=3076631 RepID=UPI00295B6F68|nr:maleylpyruvate isomerase family mycothiol-dependent enzyme [Streptomyces sp. W16]MDV9169342.1 maleylpyruvate isomerase family mycothiol-dependent enzyme [Streptomyces sp. W16]
MTPDARTHTVRAWMREGTVTLLDDLARLDDGALDASSALPGWTRRHLLAHVASNAEALRRLVAWARTNVPNAMYASPAARGADIETGSRLPAAELRAWVISSARQLAADLEELPGPAWQHQVVTAQGRTVPASEIPWLRAREISIHAIDLLAGSDFDDLPAGMCEALLLDVTTHRSARHGGPSVLLLSTDGGGPWKITGTEPEVTVSAGRAHLTRWVTGRGADGLTAEGPLPELGRWL